MRRIIILLFIISSVCSYAQQKVNVDEARPLHMNRVSVSAPMCTTSPQRAEGLSSIQRPVGHIVNSNPDSITLSGVLLGEAGTYPVGALITEEMLSPYVGCKVIGIRMAASQSLGKSRLFLYPVQDGNISDDGITKTQRLYEGWNNVFFNGDTSWEITEGAMLLVGFDYEETDAMVQNEKGGLCTVGESNGTDFLLYANLSSGEGWYSISNFGALCVQLIVDISSLPEKALSMTYLDTGFRYKDPGDDIELYVIVSNTGREAVDGYTISCRLDDNDPVNFKYTTLLKETASEHQQPIFELPDDINVGEHHLKVTLLPEDMTEPMTDKASQTADFYIYDQQKERQKVYVEQYNSQNEFMASVVNKYFNQVADENNNMVLVNVYDPESSLNIPESDYLFDLYAYTLPCFTVNRAYFPGEEYIAYDVNYYAEQYGSIVTAIIGDIVAQDMYSPSFAQLKLTPMVDENGTLHVDVTGEMVDHCLDIFDNLSVTLLITEDKVVAPQMVKNPFTMRTTIQNDYVHRHVLRTYITPPLGSQVVVEGNRFSAEGSVALDPNWNRDNITVVGILTRGTESVSDENVMKMDITNCMSVKLSSSGIKQLLNGIDSDTPELYTIGGVKVSSKDVTPGIYIWRKGSEKRKIVVR